MPPGVAPDGESDGHVPAPPHGLGQEEVGHGRAGEEENGQGHAGGPGRDGAPPQLIREEHRAQGEQAHREKRLGRRLPAARGPAARRRGRRPARARSWRAPSPGRRRVPACRRTAASTRRLRASPLRPARARPSSRWGSRGQGRRDPPPRTPSAPRRSPSAVRRSRPPCHREPRDRRPTSAPMRGSSGRPRAPRRVPPRRPRRRSGRARANAQDREVAPGHRLDVAGARRRTHVRASPGCSRTPPARRARRRAAPGWSRTAGSWPWDPRPARAASWLRRRAPAPASPDPTRPPVDGGGGHPPRRRPRRSRR